MLGAADARVITCPDPSGPGPDRREARLMLPRRLVVFAIRPVRLRASMAVAFPIVALMLLASAAPAAAATVVTDRFSFVDDFTESDCGFPLHHVLQVEVTRERFFDDQGTLTKVIRHERWTGITTNLENGKSIGERAAITKTFDFVAGTRVTETDTGQIHGLIPQGVQDGHDRGLIVYDLLNGGILVEHGQFPGADSGGLASCGAFL
jgi:hypothetical protein